MRGILPACCALLLSASVCLAQPEIALDPQTVLKEMSARMLAADSFHAIGRQSDTASMGGMFQTTHESLVVIWYQRPNRLLWKRGATGLTFDGADLYWYAEGEPVAYRSPAPSLPLGWQYWLVVPMTGPTATQQGFDEQEFLRLLGLSATVSQSGDEISLKFSMAYERLAQVFRAMGQRGFSPWGEAMPGQLAQVLGEMKVNWEVGLNASDYLLRYVRWKMAQTGFGMTTESDLRFSVIARNTRVPAYKFRFRPPEGVEVQQGPRPEPSFGPLPTFKPPTEAAPAEPVSFADFTLKDIHGVSATLSSHAGKVVFLNFWATWCGACRWEIPELEAFWKAHEGEGDVVLLAVSEDDPGTDLLSFAQREGITFRVLLDPRSQAGDLYKIKAYPTTIVFDRNQRVVQTLVGGQTRESLEEVLAQARASGEEGSTAAPESPTSGE